MESKKRKRETETPRVTYDAATRTFDRLFKEDSLDAMKTVVRKKLGLSVSVPVYLSQWREGQAVDLEDDEDFEAFSAAARSSTAVVVKVVLGENQTLPPSEENETPSSTKRKRKKKSKRDGNASPPVIEELSEKNVVSDNSLEAVPAPKKRRVSFAEGALDVRSLLGEKSKKKDGILALDKSVTPTVDVSNTEPEQYEKKGETVKKKKKKSKKNKATDKQAEDLTEEQSKSNEGQSTLGKQSEERSIADSAASKGASDYATSDATATKFAELAPQPKQSKKRSRTGIAAGPDVQEETTTTEQPAPTAKTDDGERPTKKAKKKKSETAGSETTAAVVAADTPNIAKPTSDTQLPAPQPLSAPTDTTIQEPTKRSRKRKQKAAAEPEDKIGSEALESSTTVKNLEDTTSSGKSKKLSTPKVADAASSDQVAAQPTPIAQSLQPVSNDLAATAVPVADEPENTPAVKKSKKSKQKVDAIKPAETSSESKDVPPPPETGAQEKSKNSKDKGKDSESPVVVVAEDNANASVASVAKTPKKGGKQKKKSFDAVEQSATAEGHSTEQANASQSVALKEATRLAVLNVLKKVAEKAANQNSSSSPASGQSTSTQLQPVSSESSSADNAPVNVVSASPLTIRSTHIQSPKALVSVETSKCVEKTSGPPSKLAKESSTCPICENSPFHARSRCPVIKSGIRSMRKKIAELEKETSEGAESRSSVILELQGIIERRTKKSRVSDVVKPVVAPDVELEFPGQEAVVATSVLSPAPAPNKDSESPVEVEVTPITPSPPAPANPKSPANKPVSARLLLSQKSTQPALSSNVSSSQKASNSSQSSKSVFPQPKHIVKAALPIEFSGFGDVSLFTDQDLDALIRGPRLSVKNAVPNSETEDESEQEEEVILEEDVAVEDNATRNASRVEYPSSSDEGEEDEDEESPADTPMGIDHPTTTAIIEEADVFDDVEDSRGDLSFQEINALGSSVEPDRTADLAVHAAVGADLASINVSGLSQGNDSKVNTDESFDGTEFQVASPTKLQAPAVVEDMNVDPIEPSDVPPASQPEPIDPIISDDDMPPAESTPKSEVVVRTRSQRNAATKKVPPKASQPPASQSKVNGSAEAQVEDAPKPRTRSLMKITDLPVPPNPAIRVVRQAAVATPRTRRQLAQEQNKEREVTLEETEVAGRTRRAAAAKAKTPAKAPPKTPAKTPARAAKMTAKPLPKQGKAVAANGINDVTTKSAASAVSADQGHETTQVPPSSPAKNAPSASWVVLQESVPSQVDTDNAGMIDELLSSPTVMPLTSPRDHSGKGQKSMSVNGSQPDPLFILAESQQSFPYSQYPPDIPPMSKGFASPNDSDDENEVAAAVAQTTSGPTKKKFRSLTEITSQPTRFVPRFSQIKKPVSEPEGEDLYGRNGQESEESDSGSDSDDDNKPMSHIPAARRAGVSQSKKK